MEPKYNIMTVLEITDCEGSPLMGADVHIGTTYDITVKGFKPYQLSISDIEDYLSFNMGHIDMRVVLQRE